MRYSEKLPATISFRCDSLLISRFMASIRMKSSSYVVAAHTINHNNQSIFQRTEGDATKQHLPPDDPPICAPPFAHQNKCSLNDNTAKSGPSLCFLNTPANTAACPTNFTIVPNSVETLLTALHGTLYLSVGTIASI